MSSKYARRSQMICFTTPIVIKACNILFVTYIIKIMLNMVLSHSKNVMHLVRLAALTTLGRLCFVLSNFIYERIKMGIVRGVNTVLKRANLQYLTDQGDPDIKNGLSLMINDSRQIETNRITVQLDMTYQGLTFIGPLTFALYNSWQATIIFVVAMATPAVV